MNYDNITSTRSKGVNSSYSAQRQDPESGVETELFDGEVGEHSAKEDAEGAANDGAEGEPETGVVIGVVLLEEELCVVRPAVAAWCGKEKKITETKTDGRTNEQIFFLSFHSVRR